MKYLNLLILAITLSSCCSTKKVIDNSSKQIAKAETPKVVEAPKQQSETPEVIPTKENPVVETLEKPEVNTAEEEAPIIEHDTTFEAFDHSSYNTLLKNHVTNDGNVDYKSIKKEINTLRNYITSLSDRMPTNSWSKEDKLAYWMNAYNAMTIDLIIRNYPLKSIKDIDKPWEQRLWKLGEKWYNLNEIEHQILRKMNEPRIHFGIVCASFSCPKLRNEAFTASNLDEQLTEATKAFLTDSKRNNISQNSLKLSKIFKWFAKDFKQDGSLIDFLNNYSEITISKNAKKSFKSYNWDLND